MHQIRVRDQSKLILQVCIDKSLVNVAAILNLKNVWSFGLRFGTKQLQGLRMSENLCYFWSDAELMPSFLRKVSHF